MSKSITEKNYYQDTTHISQSMLKDFKMCPYYYKRRNIDKDFKQEGKDYFVYGQAVDTLLTEGEKAFDRQFAIVDRKISDVQSQIDSLNHELKEKQTKLHEDGKEPTASQAKRFSIIGERLIELDKLKGKEQLNPSMHKGVMGCITELERQPLFEKYGMTASKTQEIITAEFKGIKIKGKLDYIDHERQIIMDLKTTANLTTFDPQMYVKQLAWYQWLVELKYGKTYQVHIIVVDKTEYHRSNFLLYSDGTLMGGRMEMMGNLMELEEAISKGFPLPDELFEQDLHGCPVYATCKYGIRKGHLVI